MQKVIFHMDGDAFFVGVEVAKNQKLLGLPVVTGEERGIVSALSYEAKALGVVRGMPIFRIKRDFPQVIILPGDYKSYAKYSSMMFDIVRRYADDVEEYSIDECFADLTGLNKPLKMTYKEIAERIKKEVNEELKLSVSIGVAPTKVLAKVASKWVKPNGLTVIEPDTAVKFLAETEIGKIWGIGPRTSESLKRKGIQTAGDFANKPIEWIRQNFSKPYEAIWREMNSESVMDIDPNPKDIYSSIQKTRTFHPSTNDKEFLFSELAKHIEDSCKKARYYKLAPKKLSIFLKDKDFKYSEYKITLTSPTNAPEILINLANKYFKNIHRPRVLYRTAGVTLRELGSDAISQGELFGGRRLTDKFEAVHKQIDKLEDKFGRHTVYVASTHKSRKSKKVGTDAEDLDRDLLFL